ncbi:MAG: Na+:solute symporter, partial [Candidatus Eremiobacteraeota bacterium]|nr:Na+:solute symporter [Candidatus Eremiobacteraeota bacterium]
FHILLNIGAGTGLVYLLRWFWWRVNAWTEIAAMAASFVVATGLHFFGGGIDPTVQLIATVGITTVVWLIATFVTKPVDESTLVAFYNKVRPAGPGWARLRAAHDLPKSPDNLGLAFGAWIAGVAAIYCGLFGAGAFLFGNMTQGWVFTGICAIAAFSIVRLTSRLFETDAVGSGA